MDYGQLAAEKEALRSAKIRRPKALRLGSEEFLLLPNGTKSGYPFLMENDSFSVQFGEFNKPNYFVSYRSFALWQYGAERLHQRFLAWADSVGLTPYQPERLSRVDFTFDYQLNPLDFDEDNFVSSATKDNQHRKNRKVQTFRLGEGDVVLRVYNKVDEIREQSAKTWFFDLWGRGGTRLAHRMANPQGLAASLRHPYPGRPLRAARGFAPGAGIGPHHPALQDRRQQPLPLASSPNVGRPAKPCRHPAGIGHRPGIRSRRPSWKNGKPGWPSASTAI